MAASDVGLAAPALPGLSLSQCWLLLQCMSPLLAQSGHCVCFRECLLLGVSRTSINNGVAIHFAALGAKFSVHAEQELYLFQAVAGSERHSGPRSHGASENISAVRRRRLQQRSA